MPWRHERDGHACCSHCPAAASMSLIASLTVLLLVALPYCMGQVRTWPVYAPVNQVLVQACALLLLHDGHSLQPRTLSPCRWPHRHQWQANRQARRRCLDHRCNRHHHRRRRRGALLWPGRQA